MTGAPPASLASGIGLIYNKLPFRSFLWFLKKSLSDWLQLWGSPLFFQLCCNSWATYQEIWLNLTLQQQKSRLKPLEHLKIVLARLFFYGKIAQRKIHSRGIECYSTEKLREYKILFKAPSKRTLPTLWKKTSGVY